MTTAITTTCWQRATPTESRMGAKGREHFIPWAFRKIQVVGSAVSNVLSPVEYVTMGSGWGYLTPVSTISEKSKMFGELLEGFIQPLQIIYLVVDSVAIILWIRGENDELEKNHHKLSKVFLSFGLGLSRFVTLLNQYGLINMATRNLLNNTIFSGLLSIASALVTLIEVAKGEATFKKTALAILALASAGLALYVLFHSNLLLNILYLTLSTTTLFLNGDDETEHEPKPEVTEIFHNP